MKSDTLVRAPRRPWLRVAHCAPLLGALTSLPVLAAGEQQVLRPYVGYALAHDNNLLGAGDGVDGESSNAHLASAGLLVDKSISQQTLSAALHFTRIRYERLPELDNDAKDLRLNWHWRVGTHLDGNVGASYVEALAPFVNFHARERNVRSERRQFADGGWLLHPSWRLRAGTSRSTLEHDLPSQRGGDRVEQVGELGLDYLARSGSTVGTQLRHTRGRYPHRQQVNALSVDNSYQQDEVKAKINWLVTEKTQLQFLGGLVKRKHDAFTARDYSGMNARLQASWQASAKLGVALGAWREIGALEDTTVSYTLNRGLSLGSTWNATEKVRLEGQLRHETSDYSATAALASTLPERKDTVRRASLKLVYRVTPQLQLGAQAYRNERRSTLAGNTYPSSGAQLFSKYEF
jgi:exopolysaccharide biosynthesis operon protein EpsL